MAKPNLTVTLEPLQGGVATYLSSSWCSDLRRTTTGKLSYNYCTL